MGAPHQAELTQRPVEPPVEPVPAVETAGLAQ